MPRDGDSKGAIQPDKTTLQYLLAQSYLRSGQDQRHLNYFQQLLRYSHQSATVDMLLGEADDGLDRTAEAIKEFRAAAALAPNQPDVKFGLGYLYWNTTRPFQEPCPVPPAGPKYKRPARTCRSPRAALGPKP